MVWYDAGRPLARRVARRIGASLTGIRMSTGEQLGKRRTGDGSAGGDGRADLCVWRDVWELSGLEVGNLRKQVPEILVCVTRP